LPKNNINPKICQEIFQPDQKRRHRGHAALALVRAAIESVQTWKQAFMKFMPMGDISDDAIFQAR